MNTTYVKGKDLKPGMYMVTWFGTHPITAIDPYTGPFDFICGIARYPGKSGMSIETKGTYEVVDITGKEQAA